MIPTFFGLSLSQVGVLATEIMVVFAAVSIYLWFTLSDSKKVWAIAVLILGGTIISSYPIVLYWVYGDLSSS